MRGLVLSSIAAFAIVACGHGHEAATTTVTSGPFAANEPPPSGPTLKLSTTSQNLAREVCEHEQRCEHANLSTCFDVTVAKMREELLNWGCDPAATRARVKDCTASIQNQPCTVDLRTERESICPVNPVCNNYDVRLIAPGQVLPRAFE